VDFSSESLTPAGVAIVSYAWDYGDGDTSTDANPTHEYTAGQYDVTLMVTGSDGSESTVSKAAYITVGDLIFADGFEEGLSVWTGALIDGGDLSVTSGDAALVGSSGMQVDIDDNTPIYVTDDSPDSEIRYRTRFYFDPNSISMGDGDQHVIFRGDSDSVDILRIAFQKKPNGVYKVQAMTRLNNGTWRATTHHVISDAEHALELEWQAAGDGAKDGSLTLWIDGVERQRLKNLDNHTRRMERVALGAVYGIDSNTRGTFYFDAFESRRESYIGN
jgi:PKD repeat protein